jgi:hypothetical protein
VRDWDIRNVHSARPHREGWRSISPRTWSRVRGSGLSVLVPDTGLLTHDDCVNVPADLAVEEAMVNNLEPVFLCRDVGSVHMEMSFLATAWGRRSDLRIL